METIIITKDDIRETWPLGKNLNDDRINPYILRAQRRFLKPFLGEALYYDFVTDLAAPVYQLLLNGTEYELSGNTIFFNGVKPLLAAYTYSIYLKENPLHVNRAGNKNKLEENSQEVPGTTIGIKSNEAMSEGVRLQDEARRYLEDNKMLYPLYNKGVDINTPPEVGVSFTRIPRHRQR